ncbi:MAG: hypothetical protein PHI96_02175, partial [Desulfovibrio sp.]|nr:hypothetical protein [Desulfovibrio sp.]
MRASFFAFLVCLAVGVGCSVANLASATPATAANSGANARDLPEKKSVARYYNNARYSISRGMYREALHEIETGLRLDPGYAPFWVQKALVLAKLGQYEESMELTTLALGAMPDSRELQLQAVENLLALNKDDKARAISEIARHFTILGPVRLPGTVAALTEDFGRHDSRFTQILQALAVSASLPAPDQAVVTALLDNKPQRAAQLLREAINAATSGQTRNKTQLRLLGALNILTAESLQKQGKTNEAEALFAQGAALGYSKEKMLESKGNTYFETQAYDKAAQIYSENWRSATDPVLWAVNAANAYAGTGHKDEAWKILQQARTAYSEDVWLLGQLYLRMALAGKNTELQSFSHELEELGLPLALAYGTFLVARHNGDIPSMNAARENAVQHASTITLVHEQGDMRRIMKDLGFTGDESPMGRQAVRLRAQGWDFWNRGQYEDAYIYWLDSISLMPDQASKAITFNLATQFLHQNMPDKALSLLHKQFPDLSAMEFALPFILHEQWYALEPLLKNMATPSNPSLAPWYALAKAYSALKNGNAEGLEDKVKHLLATAPPHSARTVTVPDSQMGTAKVILDRERYVALLKSFFTEL